MNELERNMTSERDLCTNVVNHCHSCKESLSWTGVVAGALVATGLGFLLNIFYLGIGLSVVSNTEAGAMTVVIGGLIAAIIGGVATMFAAGWVSGFIARPYCVNRHYGILQGLSAWCLALIISLFFLGTQVGYLTYGSLLLANNISPAATVHLTANENAPAVSNVKENPPEATVNPTKAASDIGKGALATFLIFFLGAVASCVGGYCGACCHRMCNDKKQKPKPTKTVV